MIGTHAIGKTAIAGGAGGAPPPAIVCVASSIASSAVGAPVAVLATTYFVSGIPPGVQLGTPTATLLAPAITVTCATYGFRGTGVGRPTRLIYNYVPSASSGARIGTPKAVTTRFTCIAAAIQPTTQLGAATARLVVRGVASSVAPGHVGTPVCRYTIFGQVTWFCTTRLGQPRVPLAPFDLSLHVVKRRVQRYVRT